MANSLVIVAFSKEFDKSGDISRPGNVQVTANAYLYIEDAIIAHYNIPKATQAAATIARKTVAGFTYKRFSGFDDTVGKDVVVPDYEATVGSGGNSFNVVRLAHASAKTAKDKPRTCSIRFPDFFTIIMIGQALGTMILNNKPSTWKLDATGKSYPLVPATAGVPTGFKSGAWVVTAPVTPVGVEQTDKVAATNIEKGKNKKAAATTP